MVHEYASSLFDINNSHCLRAVSSVRNPSPLWLPNYPLSHWLQFAMHIGTLCAPISRSLYSSTCKIVKMISETLT